MNERLEFMQYEDLKILHFSGSFLMIQGVYLLFVSFLCSALDQSPHKDRTKLKTTELEIVQHTLLCLYSAVQPITKQLGWDLVG